MSGKNNADADLAAREIVSARRFAAPRERVFSAFSDPAQLARWWGPKGFTNTFAEFDLRPGGRWRLVMRAPNGAEFHNDSTFLEVVPPARVVFQHHEPVHGFRMTITFAAHGDETEMVWRMLFDSAGECGRVRDFVRVANDENFDRLAAVLATEPEKTDPGKAGP